VDVITNSSSELFMVDGSKVKEDLKTLFDLMIKHCESGRSCDTFIVKLSESNYADEYILPEGTNPDEVYMIYVGYDDGFLEEVVNKFFPPIEYGYK
jgi:hypothetical protein